MKIRKHQLRADKGSSIEVLPLFKHLVPKCPTYEQFDTAWKEIFDYPFNVCKVIETYHDEKNTGFVVENPGGIYSHGGFGYHTETPNLKEGQSVFYSCGCPWDTDADGNRFYLIRHGSKTIESLDKAVAVETIRKFIAQHSNDVISDKLQFNKIKQLNN